MKWQTIVRYNSSMMHKLKKKNQVFLCQICSPYLHLMEIEIFDFIYIFVFFLHKETFSVHSECYKFSPATSMTKIRERELALGSSRRCDSRVKPLGGTAGSLISYYVAKPGGLFSH